MTGGIESSSLVKRQYGFELGLTEFKWLTRRGYVEGTGQDDI